MSDSHRDDRVLARISTTQTVEIRLTLLRDNRLARLGLWLVHDDGTADATKRGIVFDRDLIPELAQALVTALLTLDRETGGG